VGPRIKFDRYRMAARIEKGRVKLLTRSGLDWTAKYPAMAAAFAQLKVNTAYIDGMRLAFFFPLLASHSGGARDGSGFSRRRICEHDTEPSACYRIIANRADHTDENRDFTLRRDVHDPARNHQSP
jgi:hypothetical protein